jgi:hypothetical protein
LKKLYLVLVIYLAATLYQSFQYCEWEGQVFRFDASGYYLYLPATFIYHDLDKLDFYEYVDTTYQPTFTRRWYSIFDQPATGKRLNKYPIGTAIGELPFFLVGHAVALNTKGEKADGYTLPYRFAICMAAIFWGLIGLYFLGKLLIGLWGDTIAAITLLIIAFGTNLYCYSVTSFGMAHVFVFMLYSMILYCTWAWHRGHKNKYIYYIAAGSALVLITRPTDIVILLVPLLWGIQDRASLLDKWYAVRKARWHFLLGALLFIAVSFLQFGYWKWVTGDFVHYSYEEEGFNFLSPKIFKGLFSFRKGWFVYTPLAVLGFIGLIPLYKRYRLLALWILIYFVFTIYIVFSWKVWTYGWSFSARALIESLAVLSIPIAAFVAYLLRQRPALQILPWLSVGFLIWMNIYQTNQYIVQALPGEGITKEYYWRVWNKMSSEEEDRKHLDDSNDFK